MARLHVSCLLFALVLMGCAHTPAGGSVETLRKAADAFHQRVRWRDFRGASELVVPERVKLFQDGRKEQRDERDLTLTDYELLDARLSADAMTGTIVSRMNWLRLPSVSEQTETVTSEFVYRGGAWFLARQQGGPFAAELEPPLAAEPPAPPQQ